MLWAARDLLDAQKTRFARSTERSNFSLHAQSAYNLFRYIPDSDCQILTQHRSDPISRVRVGVIADVSLKLAVPPICLPFQRKDINAVTGKIQVLHTVRKMLESLARHCVVRYSSKHLAWSLGSRLPGVPKLSTLETLGQSPITNSISLSTSPPNRHNAHQLVDSREHLRRSLRGPRRLWRSRLEVSRRPRSQSRQLGHRRTLSSKCLELETHHVINC